MNARSIIFLLLTAGTFFFVQNYFDSQKESQASQLLQERSDIAKKAFNKEKPLNKSDFQEISLYEKASEDSFFTKGIQIENSYLLLSNKDYPEALYVKVNNKFQKVILGANTKANTPALYGKTTPSITLSQYSNPDMFYLLSEDGMSYGKVIEKRVFTNQEEAKNAIAFIKQQGKMLPVAVYDCKGNTLRPLKDYFSIRDFVAVGKTPQFVAQESKEEYYVLENDYQQLVFSTKGGALKEINLPLKNEKNPKSMLNPVSYDGALEKDHPENALFPQNAYYTVINGKKEKVEKGTLGGYYPLIRRSLLDKSGKVKQKVSSKYYAYTILSDDEDIENLEYTVTRFDENVIEFEATQPFRKITKTFSLTKEKAPYCFDVSINIDGPTNGLYLSSGVLEVELQSGSSAPILKCKSTEMGKTSVQTLSLPQKTVTTSINTDWICNSNGFMGMILDPITKTKEGYLASSVEGKLAPSRLSLIGENHSSDKYPGYLFALPLKEGKLDLRAFSGPFQKSLLNRLDQIFADASENYNPDYAAAKTSKGWFTFISEPFGNFLFFLMQFFYKMTSSWGISIILLTIALRVMLYPLNSWSIRANQKMQAVAPKIKAMQEKYKKDPKRLQSEMMKIYREQGGSPFAGCLPGLIQLPFLLGMFELLKNTVELRGASFIPGWINNLAAPDVLFSWTYHIPLIGNEFHLLPIITGLLMFISQKMTMKAPSTGKGTEAESAQKMMAFMPIFMTVIFYNMPSGLNIYFISSTLLGMIQQKVMQKKLAKK